MPALSVGDVVQMTIRGTLFNQRIMSTFHYGISALTGAPDDSTVFSELNAAMSAAGKIQKKYLAVCPSEYVPTDVWYQVIKPVRFALRKKAWLAGTTTSTFSAGTANVAQVVYRRGAMGRRDNVSTLHIPSPTHESWIFQGLLTEDAKLALGPLCVEMLQNYSTTTGGALFYPVINNKGPLVTDITPIVDAFYDDESRVMRRRTVGRGI